MSVEEFMTTRIELVDADRSVYDTMEKMVDLHIRSLLVRFGRKKLDYGARPGTCGNRDHLRV